MRELSQTPSLFDPPPPEAPAGEEKGNDNVAKDFVRWCCSVGSDFRNSPDITNLRYWAAKTKLKIKEREEAAILDAARPLFLKRIEQSIRKSDPAN